MNHTCRTILGCDCYPLVFESTTRSRVRTVKLGSGCLPSILFCSRSNKLNLGQSVVRQQQEYGSEVAIDWVQVQQGTDIGR